MTQARIEEYLNDNGLWVYECWEDTDEFFGFPVITVYIHWGDWKHDHWRCDWLMRELGYGLVCEHITDSDGSDCYSAERKYVLTEALG